MNATYHRGMTLDTLRDEARELHDDTVALRRRLHEHPEIGNELPITMTTEQWFSPELGVVISSTHQDPMSGNTT